MEDQGKRLLLAVVAAMGIFFLWQVIFPPKKDTPPTPNGSGSGSAVVQPNQNPIGQAMPAPGPGTGSGSGTGTGAGSGSATTTAPATTGIGYAHPRDPADEIEIADMPQVYAAFSKQGGDLVSWRLKDERYETTLERGELIASLPGVGSKAPRRVLGAFDVNFFAGSTEYVPAGARWAGARQGNIVSFTYAGDKLDIAKKYTLFPADYLIKLEIDVTAKKTVTSPLSQQLALSVFGYQDPSKVIKAGRTTRQWSASCLVDGDDKSTPLAELADKSDLWGNVLWSGVEHPYLLLAMAPKGTTDQHCVAYPDPTTRGLAQVALLFSPAPLKGGETFHTEVWVYAGPKYVERLDHADTVAGFPTGFGKSVTMGWFSIIARPLLWLLLQFFSLVGNWGVSIILLTILVKLATLYWTTKSMRSMRAMASLKPKMDELQKKFKDDRARQQQEMMALYKTHGVNPLAGCLPILLQMPIWLALYRMLSTAGELYNAPFIPGWIDDLTAKDPYYILGVALVVLMFVQAKLQPATGDGMQQKMMMYVLPGVFGVMSLFFPSGLTLYILTNTILTALHSLYMRKWDKSAKMFAGAGVGAGAVAVPAGAKRVEAREVATAKVVNMPDESDDSDDAGDDDEGDDSPDDKPAQKASQKNANRPRRGQRRRGRN